MRGKAVSVSEVYTGAMQVALFATELSNADKRKLDIESAVLAIPQPLLAGAADRERCPGAFSFRSLSWCCYVGIICIRWPCRASSGIAPQPLWGLYGYSYSVVLVGARTRSGSPQLKAARIVRACAYAAKHSPARPGGQN